MNYEIKDFSKDVLQASFEKPVVVDFWAEWCGPCRVLGPVLERLAEKSNNEWLLVKINSDEHPELSAQYGIRSIPNVKLFHKGKVVNEFVGALPEPAIKDWLKKNIPNKYDDMISNAENLIFTGNDDEAIRLLNEVLKNDPQNGSAKLNRARLYLFNDTHKCLQMLSEIEENNENADVLNSLRVIAELITEVQQKPSEELNTELLFWNAAKSLKSKHFDIALENFIEIIRTDRYFRDDIARKACIAIFKYLGEENEITLKYRRDFGSALYV